MTQQIEKNVQPVFNLKNILKSLRDGPIPNLDSDST